MKGNLHHAIGKTVSDINLSAPFKSRDWDDSPTDQELLQIIFSDGSSIVLVALESDSEPFVQGRYRPRQRKARKGGA